MKIILTKFKHKRSLLSAACLIALYPAIGFSQSTTGSTATPYNVPLTTAGYRIFIVAGINNGYDELYTFDTGSTSLNILTGPQGATNPGVPWAPLVSGDVVINGSPQLYGDGSYGNLSASLNAHSLQFYTINGTLVDTPTQSFVTQGGTVSLNTGDIYTASSLGTTDAAAKQAGDTVEGYFINKTSGNGFYVSTDEYKALTGLTNITDQENSLANYYNATYKTTASPSVFAPYIANLSGAQAMYLDPSDAGNINSAESGNLIQAGIFGAGPFDTGASSAPTLLGQLTSSGYIVAANFQRTPNTNPNTNECDNCANLIINLSPALRAQFFTQPWVGGASSTTFAGSGAAMQSAQFSTMFNYTLGTVSGTTTALLDSGTPNAAIIVPQTPLTADQLNTLVDPNANPSAANTGPDYGNVFNGTTLTITGTNANDPATSVTTSETGLINAVTIGQPATTELGNSPNAIYGLTFFLQNSVMYDLENQTTGYTPYYVSDTAASTSPLSATLSASALSLTTAMSNYAKAFDALNPTQQSTFYTDASKGQSTFTDAAIQATYNAFNALSLASIANPLSSTDINALQSILPPGTVPLTDPAYSSNNFLFPDALDTAATILADPSLASFLQNGQLTVTSADPWEGLAGVISGSGGLAVTNGGYAQLSNTNTYTGGTTVAQGGSLVLAGPVVSIAASLGLQDDGVFDISRVSGGPAFITTLSGAGTVNLGAQTLALSNASGSFNGVLADGGLGGGVGGSFSLLAGRETLNGINIYTGLTDVQGGTLIVGDASHTTAALAGSAQVDSGGTLGGHGDVAGNLVVNSSGHVDPGDSIGTLSIGGDASFAQGSVLDYEFGAPGAGFNSAGVSDSVQVGGNLTLDGSVLNVTDLGGMGPGLYNLFTYGGTLTQGNDSLALGTTPANQLFQFQYLTNAKQINLLDTTGLTLNFWNANGQATANQLGGGNGTWSLTSPTWTDAVGTVTAAMQPAPGLAIFGGTAGTVTVDNSLGAVSATGLQFTQTGYVLTGDPLTLSADSTGNAPVVRVGAGSASGAGVTATINNILAGTSGLTKTDLGTLVLGGNNTYTGGTIINGGAVSVASDTNLGNAAGSVTLNGGILQVTGTAFQSTPRTLLLGSQGGGFDISDAGNTFTINQVLATTGDVSKLGAGTLALSATNTFTGATDIEGGTLALVGTGSVAASSDVVVGATSTLDLSGAAQNVSLNSLDGSGAVVLGTNSLDLTQAQGTYAGAMTGSGSLSLSAGSETLSGINTYTGATTIQGGTLAVTGSGSLAASSGVQDEGTLDISGTTAGAYLTTLSGSGQVALGRNTLELTQAHDTFAGVLSDGGIAGGSGGSLILASGVETLSGNNTYTGATGIGSAGKLMLSGSVAGSVFNAGTLVLTGTAKGSVQSTGSLLGNGYIQGNLAINGGALAPGNGAGSYQTLSVAGNYTQAAGSSYVAQVNLAQPGVASQLAVQGSAQLASGALLQVMTQGTPAEGLYQPGARYDLLSANQGLTGTYTLTAAPLSVSAVLELAPVYDANHVYLGVVQQRSLLMAAQSPNQAVTLGAVQSLSATQGAYVAAANLPTDAAIRGLADQLSGEGYASTQAALLDDSHYVRDAINAHLLGESQGPEVANAHGGSLWSTVWASGATQDGNGNAANLNHDSSGVLVGSDIGLGNSTQLGAVMGTGSSMIVDARGSNSHAKTDYVGLYGSTDLGGFALRGGVTYSHYTIDAHRTIGAADFYELTGAHYRANAGQAYVEGGYRFDLSHGSLEPFVNLARVQLKTDGFHEYGGAAALDGAGESAPVNYGTVGVHGKWTLNATGDIAGYADLGYQQAWRQVHTDQTLQFASGGTAFTVDGVPIAQHAGVVGAGITLKIAKQTTVDAGYQGQFAAHAKDQGASMNIRVAF